MATWHPPDFLHQLPHDGLTAIFQRVRADDLDRLCSIPCHAISTAARSESAWAPILSRLFGRTLAESAMKCSSRICKQQAVPVDDESALFMALINIINADDESALFMALINIIDKDATNASRWKFVHNITAQDEIILSQAKAAWEKQPGPQTAFHFLSRLIPLSFASKDPEDVPILCQILAREEPSLAEQATIISELTHLAMRLWGESRVAHTKDRKIRAKGASALNSFLAQRKSSG